MVFVSYRSHAQVCCVMVAGSAGSCSLAGVHRGFTVWGGKLKTFGVYVMGVHKQAPNRGIWRLPSPDFFLQNRCSQIDSDTVASCHRIYTIIIRKANHTTE